MLGAIIGDLAGTKYEYQEFLDSRKGVINLERRKSILRPDIELISDDSFISDDSILTMAIAESIVYGIDYEQTLKKYGKAYGNTKNNKENFFNNVFSPNFIKWANNPNNEKGLSQGNGAAMRVSPIGYLFNDLNKVQKEARKSAIPSHNSIQAIAGAEAIACSIFLARNHYKKHEIKEYIYQKYGYNMNLNLEELQKNNVFDGTCEITVPQSIFIFLESSNFEDSIRKAISIGGDTDTIACMVGSISEAYYGIPKNLRDKALNQLPQEFKDILIKAYQYIKNNKKIQEEIEK